MKIKFINKYYSILLAAGVVLFSACEDGDQVIDQIMEGETRGAILRTVNYETNEIAIGNTDYMFEVDVEVQDHANGTNVSQVEVYLSFADNTIEDGDPDLSQGEVLVETLDASTFGVGEFGLPRTTYSISLDSMLSAFGLSTADIFVTGGDEFTVRFELVLSDGRRYSVADNSGTLTGSYFSSPFQYTTVVVCPPLAPSAGIWTINMTDAYGDGWNGGAGFDITIDGTVHNITLESGDAGTATIDVPEGASAISIIFNSGTWDPEIGATIVSSTGTTIVEFIADPAQGQEPIHPSGVELIDYCDLSLDI